MPRYVVYMPTSLLLTRELLASAKLVWLALNMEPDLDSHLLLSPTRLSNRIGLSRPTIRKALAQLIDLGWYAPLTAGVSPKLPKLAGKRVRIPGALIIEKSLSVHTRLLYGMLQAVHCRNREFRYATLARQINLCATTVRRAVFDLHETGWLGFEQKNQHKPVSFSLQNPTIAGYKQMQNELDNCKFQGETILRWILNIFYTPKDWEDDASPGYLVNGATGKRMQLDRYYESYGVALEFQGPQHKRPTKRFDAETVAKQKVRDRKKARIVKRRRINLIEIWPDELTIDTVIKKVGDLLPKRDLTFYQKHVNFLHERCHKYQESVKSGWIDKG